MDVRPRRVRASALEARIEMVYRTRFDAFLRTMTAMLRDGDAAREVVQEGFARALKARDSYRGESNLEGWIWQITMNIARDRRRRAGREVLAADPPFREAASLDTSDSDLSDAVHRLPERARLTLFLHYYADLSYGEVAEVLGVSAGTVGATLTSARNALRSELQEVTR